VKVLHRPTRLLGRVALDLRIYGREHVPTGGAVIFAANHLSHIDPPLVSLVHHHNVRYLALDELYGTYPIFDYVTLYFGAIPLSRTRAPLGALREALWELEGGGAVGVFPEGKRVAFWGEVPPKHGAAWLALRTGTPVVPVAIAGTEGTMSVAQPGIRRTKVRVWADPPLYPDTYLDRADPLGSMMEDWRLALDHHLAPWFRGDLA
jgi:1-acyl-sn-glycerol-3-phosphate acyltransferase